MTRLQASCTKARTPITLTAGESHQIDLRAYANATDDLSVRFAWVTPETKDNAIASAVQAAQTAKKVVVFAYDEGTEGSDRGGNSIADGLKLPGYQDDADLGACCGQPEHGGRAQHW